MTQSPQAEPRATPQNKSAIVGRPPRPEPVSGDDIIEWIEAVLYIPDDKVGAKQVSLLDFQKRAIRAIYDNKHGTRRAILSFGRKNGKTGLAAFLLLNRLCGPSGAHQPNAELFSTAQSRDQAALIFKMAATIVRLSPHIRNAVHIKDTTKELICTKLNNHYRALSAEAATAFGLNPSFVVHDELGQVRGPRSTLYEALETATGAQRAPLSIIISTQAPTDGDLLSTLIDDAQSGNDKRVKLMFYTADKELDPFDLKTIKKANPALGHFLNTKEVQAMAADAKRMPAREAEFRNYILNQRVEPNNPFVTSDAWKACATPVADLRGVRCYAGLDLSSVADLTALVIVGRIDNTWHVHPTFWLPEDGLYAKAHEDRVPYDKWKEQGFLHTTPGATVSYEWVAQHLFNEIFPKYNIRKLGFDKWNFKNFVPWLIKAGFNEQVIADKFVEFQQGTMSMSPALRELEAAIKSKQLAHGGHKLLTANAMNAVVYSKDESNRKLDKQKSTGRIDGMVALAMAIGIGSQYDKVVDVNALIG